MEKLHALSLFCLLTSSLPGTSGQFPCPDPEDISPCTCSYDEGRLEITADCSAATPGEIFSAFNDATWFSKLTKLNVWSNEAVTVLQKGIFGDISFQYMNVYDAPNLVAIRPSALLPSRDRLVDASFGFGRLRDFPWHILPQMAALTRLDFNGNALTALPALQSDTLQYLILRDNRISSVEGGWSVPNLKHLDMYGNPVSKLPAGFLSGFEKLVMFYCSDCNLGPTLHSGSLEFNSQDLDLLLLDGNNIVTVEAGAFSGLTANSHIILLDNLITEVTEEVFRPMLEVFSSGNGYVSLDRNPIRCDCSMAWLMLEADLLEHTFGSCENGLYFHNLDPNVFETFCIKMNPPMAGDYSTWI